MPEPPFSERALTTDQIQNLQARLRANELRIDSSTAPEMASQATLASNTRESAGLHQMSLGKQGLLCLGRIVIAIPYCNWYKVQLSDGGGDIGCSKGSETGLYPFSVRETSPLGPGQFVLVHRPAESTTGIILCAVPGLVQCGDLSQPDWIVQGGGSCLVAEGGLYKQLFSMLSKNCGVRDYSDSRPLDATVAGEWGRISDLGGSVFIDDAHIQLSIDEICGLFLFYADRFARLSTYNLDWNTANSQWQVRNDSGEAYNCYASAVYPWEAAGYFEQDERSIDEKSADDVHKQAIWAAYEPKEDDQSPFFRWREWRGYLGQGYLRELMAPPANAKGPWTFSDTESTPIGLFRESVGLDGSYSLTSAHSISITKRALIPIAKQLRLPEDPQGDRYTDTGGYSFSGIGDEEHKVKAMPMPDDELPHVLQAQHVADSDAHNFNWKMLHPFHYHNKDFSLPEEHSESGDSPLSVLASPPEFSSLESDTWLPPPDKKSVRIDGRYGETEYFESTSGFWQTPDGGLVFRDAYGSEILMTGGNILLRPAGDVMLMPGKSLIVWSGDDIVLRAQNSVDVTSSNADVRIKAQYNTEFLAGNGGKQGRMLFENRAASDLQEWTDAAGEEIRGSGILFKAAHSKVALMGKELYLRTGSTDGKIDAGPITIDADQGQQTVNVVADKVFRFISSYAADAFWSGASQKQKGTPTAVNSWHPACCRIGSPLIINGMLCNLRGGHLFRGYSLSVDGHYASAKSRIYEGRIGEMEKGRDYTSDMATQDDYMSRIKTTMSDIFAATFTDELYSDNGIGSSILQEKLQFSLRTADQMNTASFKLPQAWWQCIADASSGGTAWKEQDVEYHGEKMQPHPGREAWTDDSSFLQLQHKYYIVKEGYDKSRADDAYTDPQWEGWDPKSFDSGYKVIAKSVNS